MSCDKIRRLKEEQEKAWQRYLQAPKGSQEKGKHYQEWDRIKTEILQHHNAYHTNAANFDHYNI